MKMRSRSCSKLNTLRMTLPVSGLAYIPLLTLVRFRR
jgi:hypothetical protein